MFPLFDPTYIILLPAILLAFYAQMRVKNAYARWSQVPTGRGETGAAVATEILRRNGLSSVGVERIAGTLSDNYDPRTRVLRLSQGVYDTASVAAVGVAAHETGHALQHAAHYGPMWLRSSLVPVAQFGTWLAWPLFLIGFIFHSGASWTLMQLGIWFYSASVAFTLITLPVEFDASRRAMRTLSSEGLVTRDELAGVRSMLSAAALTYVAAAATAALQLVRLLMLANMRRRE